VTGLVAVFNVITREGLGNPAAMSGGISQALLTTVAGLCVAIPALVAYRFFRGRIAELVVRMEEESIRLVDALHQRRRRG
jgi:biopolymer transport protein ExbB